MKMRQETRDYFSTRYQTAAGEIQGFLQFAGYGEWLRSIFKDRAILYSVASVTMIFALILPDMGIISPIGTIAALLALGGILGYALNVIFSFINRAIKIVDQLYPKGATHKIVASYRRHPFWHIGIARNAILTNSHNWFSKKPLIRDILIASGTALSPLGLGSVGLIAPICGFLVIFGLAFLGAVSLLAILTLFKLADYINPTSFKAAIQPIYKSFASMLDSIFGGMLDNYVEAKLHPEIAHERRLTEQAAKIQKRAKLTPKKKQPTENAEYNEDRIEVMPFASGEDISAIKKEMYASDTYTPPNDTPESTQESHNFIDDSEDYIIEDYTMDEDELSEFEAGFEDDDNFEIPLQMVNVEDDFDNLGKMPFYKPQTTGRVTEEWRLIYAQRGVLGQIEMPS